MDRIQLRLFRSLNFTPAEEEANQSEQTEGSQTGQPRFR
jgi:hypothetical protein